VREVLPGGQRADDGDGRHGARPLPRPIDRGAVWGTCVVRFGDRQGIDVHVHDAGGVMNSTDTPKRLLLVEDDRFLRRACEIALRKRGFTVTTATDGQEALVALRQERPDLVLLDMLMPRLSGVDVLRTVRADPALHDVPVLVLSNSSR